MLIFSACGDGPISANEIDEIADNVRKNEIWQEKDYSNDKDFYDEDDYYYRSSSSYKKSSSSYNYEYYRSSSSVGSYSSQTSNYLEKSATLTITLNYYHQLKKMDGNNTNDGDPKICPNFVDEDALFEDHEYSSNFRYIVSNAGMHVGEEINQEDYEASYYELEWRLKYI